MLKNKWSCTKLIGGGGPGGGSKNLILGQVQIFNVIYFIYTFQHNIKTVAVIHPLYTTSFAVVGRSSDHLVCCWSWRYTKRITLRSVVYTKCDSKRMNSNIYNKTSVLRSIYYSDEWLVHQNLLSRRGIYRFQYTKSEKNVTKFDILHRRLSHRIVSVLLPYSGVTTGFFHGGWIILKTMMLKLSQLSFKIL